MASFDKNIPLKSKTYKLYDFFTQESRKVGFRVPEYQRNYDWDDKNIDDLLESCLNGYKNYRKTKKDHFLPHCYLGTIILVKYGEEEQKDLAGGISMSIVDGQQRITTLALIAIALINDILAFKNKIVLINENEKTWLNNEINLQIHNLHTCAIGDRDYYGHFPRIIRDRDHRGVEKNKVKNDSEYRSSIGNFLNNFSKFFDFQDNDGFKIGVDDVNRFNKTLLLDPTRNDEKYKELSCKYKKIHAKMIQRIYPPINSNDYVVSNDSTKKFEPLSISEIKSNNNIENLFQTKPKKTVQKIIANTKATDHLDLLRVLLFSSYFLNYVVLTQVTTEEENLGFDVFDALNTTGEPLTALETLKPLVFKSFDESKENYHGSRSEKSYLEIEENLNFEDAKDKQTKTKELIISFALYSNGERISKDLKEQREYLRHNFTRLPANKLPEKLQEKFVEEIANIAKYRRSYWEKDGINEIIEFENENRILPLCFRLISDMRTSMAIPALARYWVNHVESKGRSGEKKAAHDFISAVKAITAFIVIRRAATGSTDGIDHDFTTLMQEKEDGLCLGLNHDRKLLELPDLKKALSNKLIKKFSSKLNKKDYLSSLISGDWWFDKVTYENPLIRHSREISKFLILASSHYSRPCPNNPGLLINGKFERDDKYKFLTYDSWRDSKHKTVEHIAPSTRPPEGWHDSIYDNDDTRDSIGNLTLLPQKENSSIGNASWNRKKIFYLAITEEDTKDAIQKIEEAESTGIEFPTRMKKLIENGKRLPILDPIRNAILADKKWNLEIINARSRNIAELTWKKISPWLFDD